MNEFMRGALDEARAGAAEGGIPIGAVLVDGGRIVARGHNRRIQDSAPVMHGEINCLYNAGKTVDNFNGMTIYSTLMPCHMCAGAIVQFGITKVYAGESETFDEGRELIERHGIDVIDMDLGSSASIGAKQRKGFQSMIASIALGDVGLILSREVSRLSRTDKDWCQLQEVCQVFGVLVGDAERIYDLGQMDDQLVL